MDSFLALLTASYGRHYLAQRISKDALGNQILGNELIQVSTPAKQHIGAVGDRLLLESTSADQARIIEIEPRENLLYRSDAFKSKLIASNVDQILVVLATQPAFSPDLLGRAVVAAETNQIGLHILLNKSDLKDNLVHARTIIEPYVRMGYPVSEVSAKFDAESIDALRPALQGKASVFVGQSGMGKSSLLNAWVPNAAALTQEYSVRLDTGKHTTTACRYFELPEAWGRDTSGRLGALIDSPGFQEFGLHHIAPTQLANLMPDIKAHASQCRFYNCTHLHEPGCGVLAQVEAETGLGAISARRHRIYKQLFDELGQQRW